MSIQLTKYFRDSVAAKLPIDFKKNKYEMISNKDFTLGKISNEMFQSLFSNNESKEEHEVIIVARTIKTIYEGQEKWHNNNEELSGVYYVPARLDVNGNLYPPEEKTPWLPREYLFPIIEESLAIGSLEAFDEFLSNFSTEFKKCTEWNDYFRLCKHLYEKTTSRGFGDQVINGIPLMENIYIFKDDTIIATKNILALYDDLLKGNFNKSKLYLNFVNMDFKPIKPLLNNSFEESIKHIGQMGGNYGLSPSQRECLIHFNNMEEGEILAVNGPPGTGKTTLLQTLVANLYVEKALKKEKAPFIVASSTNNQAVTNIIESFGNLEKKWGDNLENRWVEGVDSFAVYFPSGRKIKKAKEKGFQYTNIHGHHFFERIESEENIRRSSQKFLSECSSYFNKTLYSLKDCEEEIHNRLIKVTNANHDIIKLYKNYFNICETGKNINKSICELDNEIVNSKLKLQKLKSELNQWEEKYKKIPLIYRLFKFLPNFKKKIREELNLSNEIGEDSKGLRGIEDIHSKYSALITNVREEISNKVDKNVKIKEIKAKLNEALNDLNQGPELPIFCVENINGLNDILDTSLRYTSFWLAVHYYECKWLKSVRLSAQQKGKTFENVLDIFYGNLSMISPCYVMTFYQLPKLLRAYVGKKYNKYLYNKIDLLIVDEAGQVSPEIAACSFSLAKRAVVVGDVNQVEPVWNIHRTLDISLAIKAGVISHKDEFENLILNGLNASESSVMKVASKCSNYEKFGDRGLFLSEHRRCYNEIIEYCNQLVYKGNLEPLRGLGEKDKKSKLSEISLPHMGHYQINSDSSSKRAGSRYNEIEANQIATWVVNNFEQLKKIYPEKKPKEILGIITPFKIQVSEIKRALPKELSNVISVGTIHTFQGGERQIIIMSTVYGKNEGCYFIDQSKSMMNVAVSRAKDSFLVFGEKGCLSNSEAMPSGMLKRMVKKF